MNADDARAWSLEFNKPSTEPRLGRYRGWLYRDHSVLRQSPADASGVCGCETGVNEQQRPVTGAAFANEVRHID